MTNAEIFSAYVEAFEETYQDEDWSRLEVYFTENALYVTGDGQEIFGRDSIISYLTDSVESVDRRFDSRSPIFSVPETSGTKVSVSWKLTFSKDGAPDLVSNGSEIAEFDDGAICQLNSVFGEGVIERARVWMEKYGELLA